VTSANNRQAVIFDFDGVIALSEPTHARAWHDVAEAMACALPDGFIESGIGHSDPMLADHLGEHWGGRDGAEILKAKQHHFRERIATEGELVPGASALIDKLFRRYPMAVATSSTREDLAPLMEREDLWPKFKTILTRDCVAKPKPDPEIYLRAAEALEVAPAMCWVFEDSVQGVRAARGAGMKVIGITTTFHAEKLSPVRACFDNFLNLREIEEIISSGSD